MTKQNILIIGGTGYIGSKLTHVLRNDFNVAIVDINPVNSKEIENIPIKKEDMNNLTRKDVKDFETIIVLAGNSSVKSSSNLFSTHYNNVENFIHILKITDKTQKVIYASSSSVYGDTKDRVVNEDNLILKSHNYYDFTKKIADLYAEMAIEKEHRQLFGLRFGTVNGYSPNFRNDIMINAMTNNALTKGEINVFAKNTARPILAIKDLCRAVVSIINKGNLKTAGVYNLASFNTNVDTIAKTLSKKLNIPIKYLDEIPTKKATNVKLQTSSYNFAIDTTRFCEVFDFQFNETVETIADDILTNYNIIEKNHNRHADFYLSHVFSSTEKTECRVCKNPVELLFDLGDQPLANNYHNNDKKQEKYPLKLMLCNDCYHLQLSHVVNPDIMFKDYIYVSGTSKSLQVHFKDLAKLISTLFQKEGTVLEIACNDGSQLDQFKPLGWKTIGVDPAENLYKLSSVKDHQIYCDYWNVKVAQKIKDEHKEVDAIVCQNVFAHVNDIDEFLQASKMLMNDNSKLFIQTSQANLVRLKQMDTIYHEHLSFFNINSMNTIVNAHNMVIQQCYKPEIHGTSYLFQIGLKQLEYSNTEELLSEETNIGLNTKQTYLDYVDTCKKRCLDLKLKMLEKLKEGYTIVGYGASAKGNTLLNYMNITDEISFIVDDNSLKQNLYTPGTNIHIKHPQEIKNIEKLAILMITWNFDKEIKGRVNSIRGEDTTEYIYY